MKAAVLAWRGGGGRGRRRREVEGMFGGEKQGRFVIRYLIKGGS
jgi:hypothetical protein